MSGWLALYLIIGGLWLAVFGIISLIATGVWISHGSPDDKERDDLRELVRLWLAGFVWPLLLAWLLVRALWVGFGPERKVWIGR